MFCSKCGSENSNDAKFCNSCGNALNSSLAQTTTNIQSNSATPSTTSQQTYANFWRRGAAAIVDLQVLGFGYIGFARLFSNSVAETSLAFDLAFMLFVAIYFSGSESRNDSATLGKRLFHLSVLRTDKSKLSFVRAFARFLCRTLSLIPLGVGYLIQPFNSKKQTLHDMMTDSVVIQNQDGRAALVWVAWCFQIVILVISFALIARDIDANQSSNEQAMTEAVSPTIAPSTNDTYSNVDIASPRQNSSEGCDSNQNALSYEYEPNLVSLRGKLVLAKGEADDQPITYPALQLANPISVKGSDEINTFESGVVLIQLGLNEQLWAVYQQAKGTDVIVTGTLYHAITGHHYTNVLMTVNQINKSQPMCVQ